MERYRNTRGDSGVHAYEIGASYIKIMFSGTSGTYVYSYGKAGVSHVEQMKILARNGSGLNSYINRYVKDLHD